MAGFKGLIDYAGYSVGSLPIPLLSYQSFPVSYDEGQWPPAPTDHFTTTTFFAGTWEGTRLCRAHNPATAGGYEFDYESDQGSISIDGGDPKRDIRGVTYVGPQMADQKSPSTTLRITVKARAFDNDPPMLVRVAVAMAQWKANDTLGTVYLNKKVSIDLGTTYTSNGAVIVTQLLSGGVTLDAGDRIVADVWIEAENTSGVNRNGRWGFLKWGLWDDPLVGNTTRIFSTSPLYTLQGIQLPAHAWGVL
jgi:hypothetical protein